MEQGEPGLPDQATTEVTEELRARYAEERQKRLRPEGHGQYVAIRQLKDFDADPYAPPLVREPIAVDTEVVIVGAGWGGMLAAAFLRQHGVDDIRIIDKAADFGGTWYWNRYPGCMCDVESYIYLPLLEETGYMPAKRYAHASEILAYAQLLGRRFELNERAIFQTEVVGAVWDDNVHRWNVLTSRGDRISTRFLVICGGVLHKAKVPNIPGIEDFAGDTFHTSRWDYTVTGGGPEEPMDALADKVVGIVGTGATSVQAVPQLAEAAKHLYVFQRTPSTVSPRNQKDTDAAWFAEMSARPGWQQERIDNFTRMTSGKQTDFDLVRDGWSALLGESTKRAPRDEEDATQLELLDFQRMQGIRDRIDGIVRDQETADRLKPWYKLNCKRPCFHDEYLPTFNRDNVTLVDTDGRGIERITKGGVVANGEEHLVDILVFASGFEVGSSYAHRLGFDPKGEHGESLSGAWAEGPATAFSTMTRGFPNMLMSSAVQGGQDVNFTFVLTQNAEQITHVITETLGRRATKVQPSSEAEEKWLAVIFGAMASNGAYYANCTPGYLNNEGRPAEMPLLKSSPYMGSAWDFAELLAAWRDQGDLGGFDVTP